MDDIAMDNELAAWDDRQPAFEKQDPIWTLLAYRLARWAMDLATGDLRRARGIAAESRDQLTRSISSVAANIAEGHARVTAKERARYYSIALGSVREAGVWYASIAHYLPDGVATARCAVLARIRRLLFGLIKRGDTSRWLGPRGKSSPPSPAG